jgi:hypothetical protein
MKIRLRKASQPFQEFLGVARQLIGFWAKFTGTVVATTVIFGPFAPLAGVAFLLTLGMPILLLVLWGQALEVELRWTEHNEGAW